MAKGVARVRSGIWQLENNEPLQSGTLRKLPKLHGEKERLPTYRKGRAPLSGKKAPRLHGRNEAAEGKGRFRCTSLLMRRFSQ
jgi:hypothetical protein